MRTTILFLIVSCLTACLDEPDLPGPVVYLTLGESYGLRPTGAESGWNENDAAWIWQGAAKWRELGFDVRPYDEEIDPSLTELPTSVVDYPPTEEMKGSYITVGIYRDRYLEEEGMFAGLHPSDGQRVVYINSGIRFGYLMEVVAHENGHLLLNAGHLPDGMHGLMSGPSESEALTEDDLAFACQEAGRCDRY